MKLIIDISEELYQMCRRSCHGDADCIGSAIANGTPLDDVKAEIKAKEVAETDVAREYYNLGLGDAINILDYVGKAESEKGGRA